VAFGTALRQELKRAAIKYCPGLLTDHWLRTGRCEREAAYLRYLCAPSKIAIDVGALEGQYTAMALAYARACYTFEPQPQQVARVRALLAKVRNRVTIEQVALSDEDGVAMMKVPSYDPGRATIARSNKMESLQDLVEIGVTCRRLDGYHLRDVGFIKIDVEGHEESVVRGARETITRDKPNLLIEIEERHNPGGLRRLAALLKEWGYEGGFLEDGHVQPLSRFSLERHQNEAGLASRAPYVNNFMFSRDPKVLAALGLGHGRDGR
jgi:FkbM family methyltransferase